MILYLNQEHLITIVAPQGSVLDTLIFIMYTITLVDIVHNYPFTTRQGYADNTQVYVSFQQQNTSSGVNKLWSV